MFSEASVCPQGGMSSRGSVSRGVKTLISDTIATYDQIKLQIKFITVSNSATSETYPEIGNANIICPLLIFKV